MVTPRRWVVHRDDFRLGAPAATGPALDHVCQICEGEGDSQPHCYCEGLGVIDAERAMRIAADDPDPRWSHRPLEPVPQFTGRRCSDCAFRPDSPERERAGSAAALYRRLERGNDEASFYCHAGMHDGGRGYVPRQRDDHGAPLGHPICAGWLQEHRKANALAEATEARLAALEAEARR